jgi:hypothetical protein
MENRHDRLLAAFKRELRCIYKHGLGKAMKLDTAPTLATLAEALIASDDEYPLADRVEVVLHRAITKTELEAVLPKHDKRVESQLKLGFRTLLGLDEFNDPRVTTRRDEAAPRLGYSSGDSLRNSEREGRKVTTLLIEALADQVLILAGEQPDYARLIFGDRRISLTVTALGGYPLMDYRSLVDVTPRVKILTLTVNVDTMAAFGLDPDWSIVRGTGVRVVLPTTRSYVLHVRGYITARNEDIAEGTVDLIGGKPFQAGYMQDSAVLLSSLGRYRLDNGIVGRKGAIIGEAIMQQLVRAPDQFRFNVRVQLRLRIKT